MSALIIFDMNGEQYGFHMPAESWDDAERRMRAIRLTGKVAGWPCHTMRANALTLPFVHVWMKVSVFVRNLIGARP